MAETIHGLLLMVGAALVGALLFGAFHTLTNGTVGGVAIALTFIEAHVMDAGTAARILPCLATAAVTGLALWLMGLGADVHRIGRR